MHSTHFLMRTMHILFFCLIYINMVYYSYNNTFINLGEQYIMIKSNNSISPNQVLTIFNILRSLGFNSSHRGSKFINKSVQFVISYDTDIIILEDIYSKIAENYINVTPEQVKNDINYAINSRNKKRSEANFKSIFGFEYELSYFTNKKIIEEIARIVYYS